MRVWDKLWKGLGDTIKLNDKAEQLAAAVAHHQRRIESLTDRLTRVETRFETTVQIAGMLKDSRRV